MSSQPTQGSRWRRRIDRIAFAFIIVLWLGGSVVALAVTRPVGIAWFGVGAVYVGGQLWIERHADDHPTLTLFWVAMQRAIMGVALIVVGVIYLGWDSIVLFVFGSWYLALAVVFAWGIWHNRTLNQSDATNRS